VKNTGESSVTHDEDHSFRDTPRERASSYQSTPPVTQTLSYLEAGEMDVPGQAAMGEEGDCEVNDSEVYERQQRRLALQRAEQRSYDGIERQTRASLCSGVLAHLGLSEKPLVETHEESLLITLCDKDVMQRIAAAHAISEQEHVIEQETSEELVKALIAMAMFDGKWQGRAAALRTLGTIRKAGMTLIQEILCAALEDPHKSVRAMAAQALGKGDIPDTTNVDFSLVVNALTKAIDDPHWSVREAALESVGKLQLNACMNTVAGRLKDEDGSVRVAAVLTFASLAGKQAIPPLEDIAHNDHEQQVRRAAIIAIGRLEQHQFSELTTSIEDEREQDSTATRSTRSRSTDFLPVIMSQAHQQNSSCPSLYKQQESLIINHEAPIACEKRPPHWKSAFIRLLLCLRAIRVKVWAYIQSCIQLSLHSPKQGMAYSFLFTVAIVGAMHALHASAASSSTPQPLWIGSSMRSGSIVVHSGQQFSLQLYYQPNDTAIGPTHDHYQLVCTASIAHVDDCMGMGTVSMRGYLDGIQQQSYTSLLYLKAPSTPGMYHLQWQIKNSAGMLSTKKATIDVIVQPT
jgi:HEAT repeat protein